MNSEFCFFHDPASRRHRREAQRKGGSKRSPLQLVPAPPPHDFDFSDLKQIKELLSYAANRVARGELDPKCAYALSHLADSAIRADAASTAAERLEVLQPKKSPLTTRFDLSKLGSEEFEIYRALTEKATVPVEQP